MVQDRRKPPPEKVETSKKVTKDILKVIFVANVKYVNWLLNVVLVKKANNKWRICVDYSDL